MAKPTQASVTEIPCTCGMLDWALEEPGVPVGFDAVAREFYLRGYAGSQSPIHHCFFCGGTAPPSKRERLFFSPTRSEIERLAELTRDLPTVDEAIRRLGQPDEDYPAGLTVISPESEGRPATASTYRSLVFARLSETTNICLVDYGPQGVSFTFEGKPRQLGHDDV